ncbi:MAG: tripartite tricarboxylate transporter permease [Candidatus Hydrothermarchaeota archaeon]
MLQVLLAALVGILLGTITGLTPGLHVNTLVALMVASLPFLLGILPLYALVALIVAMAVTHTFVDYIPSILLGAPEEESVLSVLPGHRLLLQGRGYEAIRLTVIGGVGSVLLGITLLPLGVLVLPLIYSPTRRLLPLLLLTVLGFMVYTEGPGRRIMAFATMILSGVLGLLVLNGGLIPPRDALFPTLTGLFGMSALLFSLSSVAKLPRQVLAYSDVEWGRGVATGTLGGITAGLLPGIGSSQSAFLVQNLLKGGGEREFLIALGGVNTADAMYALLALYLIDNPRSGSSVAVGRLLGDLGRWDLIFLVGVVLLTTLFAAYITLAIGRVMVRSIERLDYRALSLMVISILLLTIAVLTGTRGLLVALTATAIGSIPPLAGVRRSNCMAVLVIPTVLYFL